MLEVRLVEDVCVFGWLDKLFIAVWRGSDLAASRLFYKEMKDGILRHQSGVGHLAVIEPRTPLPPSEARQLIAQVFDEHPSSVAAVSVAFEGQGFFASAVRSVATGIMMLTGTRVPFRPCGSVMDSALFLSKHMRHRGGLLPPQLCVDAVQQLRGKWSSPPGALGAASKVSP